MATTLAIWPFGCFVGWRVFKNTMNNKLFNRCVSIAKALKSESQSGRAFHTSFAIDHGRIIKIGINNYSRVYDGRFGKYKSKFVTFDYIPGIHSEIDLALKLGSQDWNGLEILNIRIDNNNKVALSKPCQNCGRIVANQFRPKRLFYSNNEGNYELFN